MTKTELKIEEILNEFGKDYVNFLKKQLQQRGKVASGKLLKSIGYKIRDLKTQTVLTINFAEYLKYVDKGVNGTRRNRNSPFSFTGQKTMINIKQLTKWVTIKGLPKNSVFPIAKKIYREGIEGENFIDNFENDFYREIVAVLRDEIPQELEKDIMVQLVF